MKSHSDILLSHSFGSEVCLLSLTKLLGLNELSASPSKNQLFLMTLLCLQIVPPFYHLPIVKTSGFFDSVVRSLVRVPSMSRPMDHVAQLLKLACMMKIQGGYSHADS